MKPMVRSLSIVILLVRDTPGRRVSFITTLLSFELQKTYTDIQTDRLDQGQPAYALDAQIGLSHPMIGLYFGRGSAQRHLADFQHVSAVGNGQSGARILLHQEDGEAIVA